MPGKAAARRWRGTAASFKVGSRGADAAAYSGVGRLRDGSSGRSRPVWVALGREFEPEQYADLGAALPACRAAEGQCKLRFSPAEDDVSVPANGRHAACVYPWIPGTLGAGMDMYVAGEVPGCTLTGDLEACRMRIGVDLHSAVPSRCLQGGGTATRIPVCIHPLPGTDTRRENAGPVGRNAYGRIEACKRRRYQLHIIDPHRTWLSRSAACVSVLRLP